MFAVGLAVYVVTLLVLWGPLSLSTSLHFRSTIMYTSYHVGVIWLFASCLPRLHAPIKPVMRKLITRSELAGQKWPVAITVVVSWSTNTGWVNLDSVQLVINLLWHELPATGTSRFRPCICAHTISTANTRDLPSEGVTLPALLPFPLTKRTHSLVKVTSRCFSAVIPVAYHANIASPSNWFNRVLYATHEVVMHKSWLHKSQLNHPPCLHTSLTISACGFLKCSKSYQSRSHDITNWATLAIVNAVSTTGYFHSPSHFQLPCPTHC